MTDYNYDDEKEFNANFYQPEHYKRGEKPGNGLGIASFVLGIIAVTIFASTLNVFFAIISIVCGIIQIVQCKKKGFAIAGIILSTVSIVLMIIFWILFTSNYKFMNLMEDYVDSVIQQYEVNEDNLFPGYDIDSEDEGNYYDFDENVEGIMDL